MRHVWLICWLTLLPVTAKALPLSAQDVVRLTVEQSPVVRSLKLNPHLTATDIETARSQYDLNLNTNVSHTKDLSERVNTVFGTESSSTTYNIGFTQLTPTGTAMNLEFQNSRQSSNSPFVTANPLFDSRALLGVTQPILKNYFGYLTRGAVDLSIKRHEVSAEQTRSQILDAAYQNVVLYWNLTLQTRLHALNNEAVTLARKTLSTNQEKLNRGLLERIDLFTFAANLNLQQGQLLFAREQIIKLENQLRQALDLVGQDIRPVTGQGFARVEPVDTITSRALGTHPILRAIRKDLEAHDIAIALQKNTRLPQLDLIGSLTLNGIDQQYGQAVSDIGDGHPIWTGGVNLSFPLQNRSARAAVQKEELLKKQKIYAYQDAENRIISLIRDAYERYAAARERVSVLTERVENQRQKWLGEITRYDQGRSSPDTVIRFQDEYLNARKFRVQAEIETQIALTDLEYASGMLIPKN